MFLDEIGIRVRERRLALGLSQDRLAKLAGLSRATVKSRTDRLVEKGVIQGFTIVLKSGADAAKVKAVMMVEIEGAATDRVAKRLTGIPQVRAIHSTNGKWDLVVDIETGSLEEFDTVLREMRALEGIITSETSLLLSRRKG